MSFDLAVWYPDKRLSDEEASERYHRLCDSDTTGVVDHPSVEAFYRELTATHPEIDDVPEDKIGDHEYSPWSVAMDRSDGHVLMCCVWSQAEYVGDIVGRLAAKHSLAVYDPQEETITYPDARMPDDDDDDDDDFEDEDADVRKPETFRDRLARRGPRVHGLFVAGMGLAGFAFNVALVAIVGRYSPLLTLAASGFLGIGLWSVATNHSFLEGDDNLPGWWKAGAFVSGAVGAFLGLLAMR